MAQQHSIPVGVEIAAAWSWRLLIIGVTGVAAVWLMRYFSELTIPLAIALLATALVVPAVDFLDRHRIPRALAAATVIIALVTVFGGLLVVIGQQMSTQATELRIAVVDGITTIQDWARTGPLGLSDGQVQAFIDRGKEAIGSADSSILSRAGSIGLQLTHFVAGVFIVLFATFFFLYEGSRMWTWVVRLFPRASRERVDSSGHTAWHSLTSFVHATVIVAFADAVGIAFSAWILGVPLTLAIGVLVFFGAFVPIIGAFVSGLVAVLVALVAQGPWTALFMLLAVIVVQQLEAQVLQPFVMGHLVAVHPLAIILAIAAGVTVAGIVGALIAVPLVACLNGVVRHLAGFSQPVLPLDPPPQAAT